ncbi:MAG: hypothetical protein COB46_04265 [Rhodospirillaceae bacterium]|nr:MAG: hypothetical protein COB46_04265 [Rhodospirillaceae bacterium]
MANTEANTADVIPAARVIIIDDDDDIRKLVAALLQAEGCEILGEAVNGAEGLDLFKNTKPDLVFLDVKMPEMDGLTALREILKVDAKAQVVMLTGLDNDMLSDDAYLAGARSYIRKDTELEILRARIGEEVSSISR